MGGPPLEPLHEEKGRRQLTNQVASRRTNGKVVPEIGEDQKASYDAEVEEMLAESTVVTALRDSSKLREKRTS